MFEFKKKICTTIVIKMLDSVYNVTMPASDLYIPRLTARICKSEVGNVTLNTISCTWITYNISNIDCMRACAFVSALRWSHYYLCHGGLFQWESFTKTVIGMKCIVKLFTQYTVNENYSNWLHRSVLAWFSTINVFKF